MPSMKSVSSVVLLALFSYIAAVAAAPYQELQPRAGYVPVYIRVGDTPLDEIHPKLAEAFHEIESSNLMLEDDNKSSEVIVMPVNDQLMEESKTIEAIAEVKPAEAVEKRDETVVPAKVAEVPKSDKESDIASFDVVKIKDTDTERPTKVEDTKADKVTDAAVKN